MKLTIELELAQYQRGGAVDWHQVHQDIGAALEAIERDNLTRASILGPHRRTRPAGCVEVRDG